MIARAQDGTLLAARLLLAAALLPTGIARALNVSGFALTLADGSVEIHQQILVERPTQRAIVLGKGGERIKQIGARARVQLATLMERPVHLYLHVKVDERWDERRDVYEGMGLEWSD